MLEGSKATTKNEPVQEAVVTESDLQCPYCLLKFFTQDDRDSHRRKKCGPKQRVSALLYVCKLATQSLRAVLLTMVYF